jgi:hypothetical protein
MEREQHRSFLEEAGERPARAFLCRQLERRSVLIT